MTTVTTPTETTKRRAGKPTADLSAIEPNPASKIMFGDRGINITSLDELWRFAKLLCASGLAPKGVDTPEKVTIAIQLGFELGLPPMRAVQSIAVVNGRPTIWGDAALGLVQASGLLEHFEERFDGNGEDLAAVCTVKRYGRATSEPCAFSVADAKRAGLWEKSGTWTTFPQRMMKYRARAFALRDNFADVLCGMHVREEMIDVQASVPESAKPVSRSNRFGFHELPQLTERDSLVGTDEPPVEEVEDESIESAEVAADLDPAPDDNTPTPAQLASARDACTRAFVAVPEQQVVELMRRINTSYGAITKCEDVQALEFWADEAREELVRIRKGVTQ